MITAVNAVLHERGEDWCARTADDIPGGMAVLDLGPLGVRLFGTHVAPGVGRRRRRRRGARSRSIAATTAPACCSRSITSPGAWA
ncbi:MAG: hypothetical protein U0168_00100 [Nannocystaceae bacterium]